MKLLFAWIGQTDLDASCGVPKAGEGPIARALDAESYDALVLLTDYEPQRVARYESWLQGRTDTTVVVHRVSLKSPTDHRAIYEAAVDVVDSSLSKFGAESGLTFHLSPGTRAMAAIWLLLSKTRYAATLIESSPQAGVQKVDVPFELSAEYLPQVLRKSDQDLVALLQGLPAAAPEFHDIIHQCDAMRKLIARAQVVAHRNVPVLLLGESGTGKELFARAIHFGSERKKRPFIRVNCGAIPEELVESELFGHVKGSFTGAVQDREGYFLAAHGGTLFLDEIGELPPQTQVRLLRALQEGEITRVGKNESDTVDVRIIAATNRNLVDEMHAGRFREDLFHRLAVAILSIPPLREREGDLGRLIDYCLEKTNREFAGQPGYQTKGLTPGARNLLLWHRWPGNVRELSNTLQRASLWSTGPEITESEVREALLELRPSADGDGILNRSLGGSFTVDEVIEEVERHYLERALGQARGKSEAARLLGMNTHQRLGDWMKRHGLSAPESWGKK